MKVLGSLVVLLIFCLGFSHGADGPCGDGQKNCTCGNFIMDCRLQHYQAFPQEIGPEIKAIYLTDNFLTSLSQIPEEAELQTLYLTNNRITKLEYDTFDNLDNLKTLFLSNNSIRSIEDDIFEWNPLKLEVLHLDGNALQFIQHFLFYDLEELTELHLQNNEITFIHPHAFLQLKNLRSLRLDGNKLHTFNHKWIEKLESNGFSTLRFENNPWSCDCAMNNSLPWIRKSKKSSWFHGLTEKGPIICTQPAALKEKLLSVVTQEEIMVKCDLPKIEGISSPSTVDLGRDVLLRCVVPAELLPVPTISWTAPNQDVYRLNTANNFDGIEVKQKGDLLIRNLSSIDNGTYTCTATNSKGSFKATTKLLVRNVTVPSPAGPTKTPMSLHTETPDAKITAIANKKCPQHCQCISRHVDCASDGTRPLTSIPDDIPSDAITINLASNQLTKLNAGDFTKFNDLEELRLDHNKISDIDPNAFSTLKGLMTLTLQENELKDIPNGLFENLESLNVLVLDKNKLTQLRSGIFEGLKELQWLYIRHNFIRIIGDDVFKPLKKIKFIHLESNQIGLIYPADVKYLFNMHHATIKKLFVDDNPFVCDCRMEELRKELHENDRIPVDFFGDGVICNSPPELAEKRLIDIKQELPACPKEETTKVGVDSVSQQASSYSGLLFGGIALGIVLTIVIAILWRKYRRSARTPSRSYNYSNLNGNDDSERRGLTDNLGNSGTEAFV